MSEQRVERRLAAIFAADVVGYSRLMGSDEEKTLAALKGHRRELIDPLITQHRGRIFKTTGDGILIEFASVVDAVRCAIVMQQGMEDRNANLPEAERIRYRIGINIGDVIVADGDIFGDGVNVAARLEALAEPGEICVSASVREQVAEKLPIGSSTGESTASRTSRARCASTESAKRSPAYRALRRKHHGRRLRSPRSRRLRYCRFRTCRTSPSRNISPTALSKTSSQRFRVTAPSS